MFFKKINHREFDHIPRFYKPELDNKERRKKKLNFRESSKLRTKSKLPIYLLVLLGIIIYFLIKLNGV
jgi:ATP/ADP translocase